MLTHIYSPRNLFNSPFEVNKTEFKAQKRFWLSAFGFIDLIVGAGHVWSRSAYLNLLMPNANLSYTIQPESFALMNPMEFINDSYVSWDFKCHRDEVEEEFLWAVGDDGEVGVDARSDFRGELDFELFIVGLCHGG